VLCCALALSACSTGGSLVDTDPAGAPGGDARPEDRSEDRSAAAFALSLHADRAYREQRWEDAVRHYRQLIGQVPMDAYSWFRLGNSYSRRGEYEHATDAYEISIQRDAQDPRPWFNLASAYLQRARQAMTQSWQHMSPGEPERLLIERRLSVLGDLMSVTDEGTGAAPASDTRR